MQLAHIEVGSDLQELTKHGSKAFPFQAYLDDMSLYYAGSIPWHWHREFELSAVVSGQVSLMTASESHILREGDGIFINSDILHSASSAADGRCVMYNFVFAPELIQSSTDSLIMEKYLYPLMNNKSFSSYIFHREEAWEAECIRTMLSMYEASLQKAFGYELKIQSHIGSLFTAFASHLPAAFAPAQNAGREEELLKDMLHYVELHLQEPITLKELASSFHGSESTCSRLFRRHLSISPFGYILTCRIEKSLPLLSDTRQTITEIAYACGFHDTSYYCRTFKRMKGITPLQFRRLSVSSSSDG